MNDELYIEEDPDLMQCGCGAIARLLVEDNGLVFRVLCTRCYISTPKYMYESQARGTWNVAMGKYEERRGHGKRKDAGSTE